MNHIFQPHRCLTREELHHHLHGTPTDDAERFRVENHLLDCPLCRDAVAGYQRTGQRQLPTTPHRGGHYALPPATGRPAGRVVALRRPKILALAASVLLLLGVGAYFLTFDPTRTQQDALAEMSDAEMTATYFSSGGNLGVVDVRGEMARIQTELPDGLKTAIDRIRDVNHTETLTVVRDYMTAQEIDHDAPTVTYYAGLAAYQAKEQDVANRLFRTVLALDSSRYREPATWFLALSLMKQGQFAECRTFLVQLRDGAENPRYRTRATELLRQME